MAPRGGGAKSGGALLKRRIFCPKTAFFGPKPPRNPRPKPTAKRPKRRQTVATLHVRLNCPVTKSSLLPPNSMIFPRNGPKMAKNDLNVRCLCPTGPKPRTDRILGYVAQNPIPRAPSPSATPHFLWFPSLRDAQRDAKTPVPVVTWCSRRAARPAHARGQRWVHQGPRMLKQVFLGCFEPVVACFGPRKIPKCLKNGLFHHQKRVKNGSRTHFSKSDPGPFGMLKQVFLGRFEPVVTRFGP